MSDQQSPSVSARPIMPSWFSAFILLLALAPLPFGSNRPWASDLLALLSGLILAFALWQERHSSVDLGSVPHKRLSFSAGAVTLVVVWAFIQVLPFPPASWHHPMWSEGRGLVEQVSGAISVDTGLFRESLLRFVSYIACFLIALIGGRDYQTARSMVKALALIGVGYAVYGLIAQAGGDETILWYKKWAYIGFVTSTFVNKNSYAAYAGLGLLCSFAYAWEHFKAMPIKDPVLAKQNKNAAFFASLGYKEFAVVLVPVIMLAALAMTGSRAGVASTFVGLVASLIALAIHRRMKTKHWGLFIGVTLLIFLLFVAIGGDSLLFRLDGSRLDSDTAMRLAAYDLAQQAIADNPWLGFGLGTFDSAFRLYRDATLPVWFHHAHNDYLEMAMDLGIPALLLLLAAIISLLSCCFTGLWQRRRHGLYPALGIGATALVATHALVDFSLHIPAVAATFSALLGLGVAQSWPTRKKEAKETGNYNDIPEEKIRVRVSTRKPADKNIAKDVEKKPLPIASRTATPEPTAKKKPARRASSTTKSSDKGKDKKQD